MLRPMPWPTFRWPMTGPTAERRRSSRLIVSVTRRSLAGDEDPELVGSRGDMNICTIRQTERDPCASRGARQHSYAEMAQSL